MSSSAYAMRDQGFGHGGAHRRQARRRVAGQTRPLRVAPLSAGGGDVGLADFRPRTPTYVWWLLGIAVALHAAGAWYVATRPPQSDARAPKHEVSVALERPKPPPPKVEPPKPQPRPLQRPAQVLPQIETPAPLPSDSESVSSLPPVPAPPPVAAAPPAPVAELPVTAAFGRAGYLDNPPPAYPAVAMRQGWQGTVVLRVRVSASGRAASVEVQKSSGRKVLDDAAVQTVQAWAFSPAKRGDTPIDGWATVPIEFKVE